MNTMISGRPFKKAIAASGAAALLAVGLWISVPRGASAHCDTMDGPVVRDARLALARGTVQPVLKWVKQDGEAEVRSAFKQALAVRGQSATVKQIADRWFFETLVRVHRAGEGEPYTGLKPAGSETDPGILAADRALESGNVDALVNHVTKAVAAGIRKRFSETVAARKQADASVSAGREFVSSYVEFIHYVERLNRDATGLESHAGHAAEAAAHNH